MDNVEKLFNRGGSGEVSNTDSTTGSSVDGTGSSLEGNEGIGVLNYNELAQLNSAHFTDHVKGGEVPVGVPLFGSYADSMRGPG